MRGDCLNRMKEIPDGSVDLVLTDPPYRVHSGGTNGCPSSKRLCKSLGNNNGKIFDNNDINFSEWLPVVYNKLKEQSHCYIMTNFKNLFELQKACIDVGFYCHNLLVWEKNNSTPNRWYMKNCEYTLFLKKGNAFSINNPSSKTVHKFTNPTKKMHPTQKPIDLMELYISNSTKEGQIVLDPFMGGGSTGVAAKNLKRDFIGIEMDDNFFDIAKKRIEHPNMTTLGEFFE